MPLELPDTSKMGSSKLMSKQRRSTIVHEAGPVGSAEAPNSWSKKLFKNASARGGQRSKARSWSVKIEHSGRRRTFSLTAADKMAAAVEAKAIFETIVAEGWDSTLNSHKTPGGFPKTDARFWKEHLYVRRYRFPAFKEPEKSLAARIGHAGNIYFFPLGTEDVDIAAQMACDIYCTIIQRGFEAACALFPRELIVAFEWSANPIMWTYTTAHTLVGRIVLPDWQNVVIVEPDPGLRSALAWCINHRPGFCAVTCESPESFAQVTAAHHPKLVLLNRSLAKRMGIEFSGGLTALPSGVLALPYSVSLDGDQMFVSTPGGAEGYMLKRVNPANLLDPILQAGKIYDASAEDHFSAVRLFFKGLLRPRTSLHADALAKLTKRENEVLLLLSKGCVDKEIAQAMGISVWTVHGHIKKIFERLNVRTRTEAVIRYLEK